MIDLKKRLEIRKEQMEASEVLMTKLRAEIQKGWIPKTAQEFAGVLKLVQDYGKKVGYHEETKDILEKIGEVKPMMEKVGVECQNNHQPTQSYMEKKASGDIQCKYCGAKFGDIQVKDGVTIKDQIKSAKSDAKGAVEKMFGM
jgi:uncharacterized Zn-finger protein